MPALPRGGGWLFAGPRATRLEEARAAAVKLVADGGCPDSAVITGPAAAALWRIREDGAGLSGRTPAGTPAWPGWEDSAVPSESLPAYLRELEALMAATASTACSTGTSATAASTRGSTSRSATGRPCCGRSRRTRRGWPPPTAGRRPASTATAGRAASCSRPCTRPSAIGLFGAVKRLFDPANLLNPGVIVDPAPLDADLRVPLAPPLRRGLGFAYAADRGDFSAAVHRCTGVGKCRADNTASGGVMCPSFLATRDEKDSTRGRARVLQELANGSLVSSGWQSPEVADALDLCLSCKGCSTDCPAGVDMATYKAEARTSGTGASSGPRPTTRSAGCPAGPRWRRARPGRRGWLTRPCGSRLRPPWPSASAGSTSGESCRYSRRGASAAGSRSGRSGRSRLSVPGPAGRPAPGPSPRRAPPVVLLWVDTFTNAFAPQVGVAAVEVLEAAGYQVRITERNVCCGLTWISTGQLDGARRQLRRTLRELGPALDAGIPVVGLEPSCTAALRADAAELLPGDARGEALGGAVKTLAELLRGTDGWTPPDLSDVTGVAQPHCHQHAVLGWHADAAILAEAGRGWTRSAAAAAWRATSASSAATTTCRSRWPRPPCCRPSAGPSHEQASGVSARRSWPTASPVVPSLTSSPTSTAPTWPSCWPRGCARCADAG